jgi:hypothetical protein
MLVKMRNHLQIETNETLVIDISRFNYVFDPLFKISLF